MCFRVVVAELVLRERGGLDGWYVRGVLSERLMSGVIVIGAEGGG